MSTGSAIWDGVLVGFGAFLATWSITFVVRLANAPVRLYHEKKDRVDQLEQLRQLTSGTQHAPSFDIGFEASAIDRGEVARFHQYHSLPLKEQKICRIWVENLEHTGEPATVSDILPLAIGERTLTARDQEILRVTIHQALHKLAARGTIERLPSVGRIARWRLASGD